MNRPTPLQSLVCPERQHCIANSISLQNAVRMVHILEQDRQRRGPRNGCRRRSETRADRQMPGSYRIAYLRSCAAPRRVDWPDKARPLLRLSCSPRLAAANIFIHSCCTSLMVDVPTFITVAPCADAMLGIQTTAAVFPSPVSKARRCSDLKFMDTLPLEATLKKGGRRSETPPEYDQRILHFTGTDRAIRWGPQTMACHQCPCSR